MKGLRSGHMRVFADRHHSGLAASLHYLLENRLGHELYFPIGMEWEERGYWKIHEPYNFAKETARQFLEINYTPNDGTNPLNNLTFVPQDGVHHIWDFNNEYYQKAITFQKFLELDIDIVIASIPAHVPAYRKMLKDIGSPAKLIYQIGNIEWHNQVPWDMVDGVMASVKEFPVPNGKHAVFYRQEFNIDFFDQSNLLTEDRVTSFVNCLPKPDYFLNLEKELSEYTFKSYGIACRDGIYQSVREIANEMGRSMFGYHLKPGGDGFGHVIHNWFAAARPVLVNISDYKDKLAGELLEDMVTCIDISTRSPNQVAGIVRELVQSGYNKMRETVDERFKQVVDFDRDANKVEVFINELMQTL